MIILVTGCLGFIGSHVCEHLLKNGEIIYGIDIIDPIANAVNDVNSVNAVVNFNVLSMYENFTYFKEDICTYDMLSSHKAYKEKYRSVPNLVIHLAGKTGVRDSFNDPVGYNNINVGGFIHLLDECVKNNVKKVIFASSSSVYGNSNNIEFSESDNLSPISPYACSKLSMEIYAKTYSHLYDIQTIGLRFFSVYGPRSRPDMVHAKLHDCLINNKPFDKYGDGTSKRDYTHVDTIVNCIFQLIYDDTPTEEEHLKQIEKIEQSKKIEKVAFSVFNVGSNNPKSLNDLISEFEHKYDKKLIINQMDKQLGDVDYTCSSVNKFTAI